MQKNNYPGKFIVIEGLDGSGQSTQVELLKKFLNKKREIIVTKEPTLDSKAGKKIRKVLDKKIKVESKNLQELFVEDRKEHLEKLIIPALKNRVTVISDRYFFSTFAYGTASGLSLEWLIEINDKFLLPDLTFILKVNPEICIQRIEKRGKKKEFFEKRKKLEKVWQIYKILPKKIKNIYIINGEESIEDVFFQIKEIFRSKIFN